MTCRQLSQASKSTWLLSTSLIAAAIAMWSGVPTSAFAAQDCAALANLKINNTNLLSAAEVPADGDLPAYCRVLGYVRPAINFEIKLPLQAWNGKFYMVGCGGFCGTVNSEARGFSNAMNFGLRRNYAVSVSDSGHWGTNAVDAGGPCIIQSPLWIGRSATFQKPPASPKSSSKPTTGLSRRSPTSLVARKVGAWASWRPSVIRRISMASSVVPRR